MNRVYWDSMLFIYLLEANPHFGPKVVQMHAEMLRRHDVLCTSVFSLGEVLTGTRRQNDSKGTKGIQEFFSSNSVEVLPFGFDAADRYSQMRAQGNLSQADAIHLATAAVTGVELFVTNDKKLRSLLIPGIRYFTDLEGKLS